MSGASEELCTSEKVSGGIVSNIVIPAYTLLLSHMNMRILAFTVYWLVLF